MTLTPEPVKPEYQRHIEAGTVPTGLCGKRYGWGPWKFRGSPCWLKEGHEGPCDPTIRIASIGGAAVSVFDEIDAKQEEHQRVVASTWPLIMQLGGHAPRVASTGLWSCSYRSTRGTRRTVRLRARTPGELLTLLLAAPDRPGRRKK